MIAGRWFVLPPRIRNKLESHGDGTDPIHSIQLVFVILCHYPFAVDHDHLRESPVTTHPTYLQREEGDSPSWSSAAKMELLPGLTTKHLDVLVFFE